jgi:alkaline phosphatase D
MKITKRAFMRLLALGGTALAGFQSISLRADVQDEPVGHPRLMQGPMLGAVSPSSILIWVRVSEEYAVSVEYSETRHFIESKRSLSVRAHSDTDLTATVEITGLAPETRYYYRVLLNGRLPKYSPDVSSDFFVTAPAPGTPTRFTVGTGSCARYVEDPHQLIWNVVAEHRPDLFVWLGDNIYGDTSRADVLSAEYRRQRGVISYAPVGPRVPQLAIWDDHDSGVDNGDRTNAAKDTALEVFRNYWANPDYGLKDAPGVFFSYQYGGVDFFLLDGRYYRDPNAMPDHEGKTMLGAQQKAWLKQALKSSTAPFKLLITGGGWSRAKGVGGDSWASFIYERNEIFDFIRDEKINGVVLLSGDAHVAELNAIPWSEKGGYDFYDLVSSPLAQDTTDNWLERRPERRIRQVYFGSVTFGLLTFDMTGSDPVLEYNSINYLGDTVWKPFRIKASELTNGVSTWETKMDDLSRERFESDRDGGEYYLPLPQFRASN